MKTLYRHHEVVYGLYHGDTEYAVVEHGVCIRSNVAGQTGAIWRDNAESPRDPWIGATVDELKAAGFTYRGVNDVIRNDAGQQYIQYQDDEPGVWYNEDGEHLPGMYERLTAADVVIQDA